MKSKTLMTGLLALAAASPAFADATINITGSTAFRSAIHNSILATMPDEQYAYSGSSLSGANFAIFKGTVPGISGVTTVRTSWSGSAAGVRDVAQANTINFLRPDTPVSSAGTANADQNNVEGAVARIAMSDVFQSSTIFTSPALQNANVAVVPFIMMANEGAPAGLTNVTDQQFDAVFGTSSLPLSLFTGNQADANTRVYGTGRDNGSGTRITVLAETQFGIFRNVQQWRPTISGGAITELQYWPTTGAGADPNQPGNGGFSSGSFVRDALGATSTGVTIKDETGATVASGQNVVVISYPGTSDAAAAEALGAKRLTYNGVAYSEDAVRTGQYTLWGYQHLYNVTGLTPDESAFRNALLAQIPNNLGAAGIALSTMQVQRSSDGGLVGP